MSFWQIACLCAVSPLGVPILWDPTAENGITVWSSDQLCELMRNRISDSIPDLKNQNLHCNKVCKWFLRMCKTLWEPTHLRTSSSGCSSQQASCSDQYSTVNGYWVLCKHSSEVLLLMHCGFYSEFYRTKCGLKCDNKIYLNCI